MPIKPPGYLDGRICRKCQANKTYKWYRHINEKGIWDRKSYLCATCYHSTRYRNLECSKIPDWRTGNLDMDSTVGKGFIGAQTIAKTLGVDDCNIKMDDFTFKVDLSRHEKYGIGEVKTVWMV